MEILVSILLVVGLGMLFWFLYEGEKHFPK